MHYNPISVAAMMRLGCKCKHHSSKYDNFSDDDNDFGLDSSVPTALNKVQAFLRFKEFYSFLIITLQPPQGNSLPTC
jgi:hypothetical protein